MGSFPNTPKKAKILHKASPKTQQSQSESESPAIKPIHKPNKQSNVQRKNYVNPKRKYPNSGQQKQFLRQFGPTNSKRPAFKSGGEVDPYSPDVAPMNIFENQVIPIGIHNISKIFRPNLATIRVLSLGMKFIPKTQLLQWKNNFANFEDFRRRLNNKMFFFVEKTPGTFVREKSFRIKSSWNCMEEYKNVNTFCFNVRDRLDNVFQ